MAPLIHDGEPGSRSLTCLCGIHDWDEYRVKAANGGTHIWFWECAHCSTRRKRDR